MTQSSSISPLGEIAGTYCDSAVCGHGFVRAPSGAFTTFDAPGGEIPPALYNQAGPPPGINPAGVIAGTFLDTGGLVEHGFVRGSNGAFTRIDVPGAISTEVLAINPPGAVVGDSCNATTCVDFLRAPDGGITAIHTPENACNSGTVPTGINPAGAVVGLTHDPSCKVSLGYLRLPDGTVTTFGIPGAFNFEAFAINPATVIAGFVFTDTFHGFRRNPDGVITTFDVPGSFGTAGFDINPAGVIIGSYFDASGAAHGFARLS